MPKTVILGAARTPFGKLGGGLSTLDATDLGGTALPPGPPERRRGGWAQRRRPPRPRPDALPTFTLGAPRPPFGARGGALSTPDARGRGARPIAAARWRGGD